MMRKEFQMTIPLLGHTIDITATVLDSGISVLLTGGCHHHIGGVCIVEGKGCKVVTNSFPNHKDYLIGERYARLLADSFDCPVSVCCGIHFDKPTSDELALVVKQCDQLLDSLIVKISD